MSETEEIAANIVPFDDGKKGRYLSYRVANFSVRESCELAKVTERSVRRWREDDATFRELDGSGLTEIRKKLSNEYLDMEFTRNFHLVLQKDFEILYKAVRNLAMTDQEHNYLIKLRSHYTPQALAMVKQILGGGGIEQPFDFTKLTLTIRREREQIDITAEQ